MSAGIEAYNLVCSITRLSTGFLQTAVQTCATLTEVEKLLKIRPGMTVRNAVPGRKRS